MGSLFNRPAWAKPHNTNEDEDSDANIFSHSNQYLDIVANQERRKKENLQRKKIKTERRTSDKHKRVKEEGDGGVLKKRRITLEDGEALLKKVGLSADLTAGVNSDEEPEGEVTELVRRSPRNNKHQRNEHLESPLKVRSRRAEVVQIPDGSDDEDEPVIQQVRAVEQAEDHESEDEFAELRRKARLQREQSGQNIKQSGNADAAAHTSSSDTNYKRPIPEDEPIVQLFIQSRIPNSKELLVHRKLSQPLDLVREAWCQKQNFPPEFHRNIFFIHRMRRVYNVTTCRSLGLEVDAFGNLTMKGAEGKEGVEKVHLEAVTEEIYAALKAERDLEAKQRSGEFPAEDQADAGGEVEDASNEEQYIRVRLVAKDSEELRLKIKPTTPLSKIAAAYSKQRLKDKEADKVDENSNNEPKVRLEFDGDTLNQNDSVQDTDISDGDIIHVYRI